MLLHGVARDHESTDVTRAVTISEKKGSAALTHGGTSRSTKLYWSLVNYLARKANITSCSALSHVQHELRKIKRSLVAYSLVTTITHSRHWTSLSLRKQVMHVKGMYNSVDNCCL
jgi:hypothetical protein